MKYNTVFAQAYGQGNYGECTYNDTTSTQCSTSTGGAGTTNNNTGTGGGLANTGMALVTLLTLACLIVLASLVVRVWRRKPVAEEVQDVAEDEEKRFSDRF
jgi:hypothetical protein